MSKNHFEKVLLLLYARWLWPIGTLFSDWVIAAISLFTSYSLASNEGQHSISFLFIQLCGSKRRSLIFILSDEKRGNGMNKKKAAGAQQVDPLARPKNHLLAAAEAPTVGRFEQKQLTKVFHWVDKRTSERSNIFVPIPGTNDKFALLVLILIPTCTWMHLVPYFQYHIIVQRRNETLGMCMLRIQTSSL